MLSKEKESREAILSFLMKETGLPQENALASISELESFGLIGFNSNGDFRSRKV